MEKFSQLADKNGHVLLWSTWAELNANSPAMSSLSLDATHLSTSKFQDPYHQLCGMEPTIQVR